MGWDRRNLITTGTQGRAVEWREGSSRKCLRRAKRSIWPKVLWAQCPLAELFICFRRWPCNVVILPSSNAAQQASRKLVQQFRMASSWEKVTKSQGKRDKARTPWRCASPQMPTAQEGSISFQQTSFFCLIWSLGWWGSSSEHGENYREKKYYGRMPQNCGLWK